MWHNVMCVSVFLTWTVPLRAALVSVDENGKAEQAAVWRVRGKGAALGFVEQDELVVDADVFRALIDDLCIRRLDRNKLKTENPEVTQPKIKHREVCKQETRETDLTQIRPKLQTLETYTVYVINIVNFSGAFDRIPWPTSGTSSGVIT